MLVLLPEGAKAFTLLRNLQRFGRQCVVVLYQWVQVDPKRVPDDAAIPRGSVCRLPSSSGR